MPAAASRGGLHQTSVHIEPSPKQLTMDHTEAKPEHEPCTFWWNSGIPARTQQRPRVPVIYLSVAKNIGGLPATEIVSESVSGTAFWKRDLDLPYNLLEPGSTVRQREMRFHQSNRTGEYR